MKDIRWRVCCRVMAFVVLDVAIRAGMTGYIFFPSIMVG